MDEQWSEENVCFVGFPDICNLAITNDCWTSSQHLYLLLVEFAPNE